MTPDQQRLRDIGDRVQNDTAHLPSETVFAWAVLYVRFINQGRDMDSPMVHGAEGIVWW